MADDQKGLLAQIDTARDALRRATDQANQLAEYADWRYVRRQLERVAQAIGRANVALLRLEVAKEEKLSPPRLFAECDGPHRHGA